MLCQKCQKAEASVHLTSVVNNAVTESHLCGQCAVGAAIPGITGVGPPGVAGAMAAEVQSMLNHALEAAMAADAMGEALGGPAAKCPHCGTTAADIRRTGKLGCPRDYETFNMQGLVAAAQAGATRHVGKVPGRASPEVKLAVLTARAEQLQGRLDGAVRREDYESAAKLRDEIGTTREEIARLA